MAGAHSAAVRKRIEALFQGGTVGNLTDGQLLERFAQRRDAVSEQAFAALVERHGAMVLRVCRNLLGDPHEAEDAAQATFLVLARNAGSIRQTDSVASWLFGVACRVAAKAKTRAARRRALERRGAAMASRTPSEELERESWPELYEELDRLPERYRRPIVLCHLEGLSYAQAAQQLHCPVRTLQTRLVRGRERLRGRLARRGVTLSASVLSAALAPEATRAAMPSATWAVATVQAAFPFGARRSAEAAGLASASAITLAEVTLGAMLRAKLKLVTIAALIVGGAMAVEVVAWRRPRGGGSTDGRSRRKRHHTRGEPGAGAKPVPSRDGRGRRRPSAAGPAPEAPGRG